MQGLAVRPPRADQQHAAEYGRNACHCAGALDAVTVWGAAGLTGKVIDCNRPSQCRAHATLAGLHTPPPACTQLNNPAAGRRVDGSLGPKMRKSLPLQGRPRARRSRDTVKTPHGLQALIDDGVIDEVLRPLKSGKEAAVYVVRSGDDVRCAKVYKDMAQRSFQQRVQYQEGRKVRGSREARAVGKASNYGRKQQEAAWKNTEVDALYQLRDAGVRVPEPYGYFHGVLVMELVTDAEGYSAARLGEVELSPEQAREFHQILVRQVVRMLCCGLIHGDLSPYNVLVGPEGPVVIDFPQVVSAAGNNAARTMLLRDVNNLTAYLGRWAPELLETWYGEEMWALFEAGDLLPDSVLTGEFEQDESTIDLDGVRHAINDAREEALIRQQGREAAEENDD